MNNFLNFRIHGLVGVLSLTALAAVAQDGSGFCAGTAVVDISPTVFPIQLHSGPSDYVHDPLHVRAIAFENGEGRAVIAVVDAIGVGREMCDEAKSVVAEKTGWKPSEMLVAQPTPIALPKVTEEDGKIVGMASADYFGQFARIMPYRVGGGNPPENFVAMMTNGASGDINNIDFYGKRPPRAPFEQVRVVATKTADAAWRAVKKIEQYDEDPIVAVLQREVTLKYRHPTEAQVERAQKLLELPRKEREELHKRATQYANSTLRFADPEYPETEDVIVQAIRIGDQAIVSMPLEVLVEIGLEIKEKSPFPRTFLIELANGGYGYLPPPHQHELGGYETWIGTSRFEEDSSLILTQNLLAMLEELKTL